MKIVVAVLLILVVLGCGAGCSYVSRRNDMVTMQEAIKSSWSQVDIALQRRADLIPNLVATVKGYATHEEKAIADVSNARAGLMGAKTPQERIAANDQLSSTLSRLLVIVENYPNLKANENFIRLQDELSGTENRISVERRKYNDSVQRYNTYIQLFPNSIVAGMGGFQRQDAYFKADSGAKEVPKVQF